MECLRLRVKDLDFAQHQILVRDGKGEKDRVTMLPESVVVPLQDHLRIVKRTHGEDLAKGYGAVYLLCCRSWMIDKTVSYLKGTSRPCHHECAHPVGDRCAWR